MDKVCRDNFAPESEDLPAELKPLVEAYAVIDRGVAGDVLKHSLKHRAELACKRGCAECCGQTDIPLYPLEARGIAWYVRERMEAVLREVIMGRVRELRKLGRAEERRLSGQGCVFLVDGACTVHLMRPVACRLYNVFGAECAQGEDPYYTRRVEVLEPSAEARERAFFLMLPYYGITDDTERYYAIQDGWLDRQAVNLREYEWRELGE